MAIIQPIQKIAPRIVNMTPYELYLQRVKGVYDNIRATDAGLDYIPPDFGGLFGQRETLAAAAALELIEFQVPGNV